MINLTRCYEAVSRDLNTIYSFLSTNKIKQGEEQKILNSYYLMLESQHILEILNNQSEADLPGENERAASTQLYQQVITCFANIESEYLSNASESKRRSYELGKLNKQRLFEGNKEAIENNLGSIAQAYVSYEQIEKKLNDSVKGFKGIQIKKVILHKKIKLKISSRGKIAISRDNNTLSVTLPLSIELHMRKWWKYKKLDTLKATVTFPLVFGTSSNALGISVGKAKFKAKKLRRSDYLFGILPILALKKTINWAVEKYVLKPKVVEINNTLNETLQWENINMEFQNRIQGMEVCGLNPKVTISPEMNGISAGVDLKQDIGLRVDYSLIESYIPETTLSLPYLGELRVSRVGLSCQENKLSVNLFVDGAINGMLQVNCKPSFDPKSGTISINNLDFSAETTSLITNLLVNNAAKLKDLKIVSEKIKQKLSYLIKTRLLTVPLEKIIRDKVNGLNLPCIDIDSSKINLFALEFGSRELSIKFGKSILPLALLEEADENQELNVTPEPELEDSLEVSFTP